MARLAGSAKTVADKKAADKKVHKRAGAKKQLRTVAGTVLTRAYENQLAAEAEAGFDLSTVQVRRVGRPSLNGGAGKSRRLDLRVDDEIFDAVHELAEREQRPVSEVVRDALRRHLDASLPRLS